MTNSVLADSFPSTIDISSAISSKGSFTLSTHSFTLPLGSIAPGDMITVTIIAKVNATAKTTESLSNVVTLTYDPNKSKTASASYRVIAGSTLPGTGEMPLDAPPALDWSLLFAAAVAALAGVFTLWYGWMLRANQQDGGGRALGMGALLLIGAALLGAAQLNGGWFDANSPAVEEPALIVFRSTPTTTPEMLAGFALAPSTPDLSDYRFDPTSAAQTLPDFPIPSPTFIPTAASPAEQPDTSAATRLVIASLGIDAVVKYVPFNGETWLISGMKQEIAWLGNTSWPGLGGNTALAGHVTVRGGSGGAENGPFRYLDQLQPGDEVMVETLEKRYRYTVRELRVVGESDLSVLQPGEQPQLTLITCTDWSSDFHLYLKRLIVFADLQTSEALQ